MGSQKDPTNTVTMDDFAVELAFSLGIASYLEVHIFVRETPVVVQLKSFSVG